MAGLSLTTLEHRVPAVAAAILAVQHAAYAKEARLIGVGRFAPLERRAADIESSGESFLGAYADGELAGVLSHEAGPLKNERTLSGLVVAPMWQRQGIATQLLDAFLQESGEAHIYVSTASRNSAALPLYQAFGFVEYGRTRRGSELIELVLLRLVRDAQGRQAR
jgi:ribosomal protein S18 acetylase RimI-like enzyme